MRNYVINSDGTVERIGARDEFKEEKSEEVTKVLKRGNGIVKLNVDPELRNEIRKKRVAAITYKQKKQGETQLKRHQYLVKIKGKYNILNQCDLPKVVKSFILEKYKILGNMTFVTINKKRLKIINEINTVYDVLIRKYVNKEKINAKLLYNLNLSIDMIKALLNKDVDYEEVLESLSKNNKKEGQTSWAWQELARRKD